MIGLYYSWYSICSEKVLICLFEKQLRFEGRLVDLFDFAQVKPDYLAINPEGIVPTLVHDGRKIFESTIINEYLNEVATEPRLLPADPAERAEARHWVQQFQDFVFPSLAIISQPTFIAPELARRWSQAELESLIAQKRNAEKRRRQLRAVRDGIPAQDIADAEARVLRVLDKMEAGLADGREWLAGDFSLADIAAAPNVYRCEILGRMDLIDARPGLARWYRGLRARRSFIETYRFAPSVRRDSPRVN
ncbi:MAG: glutathione S-transferase family protein [Rhodospirillaceae bacterium]|nr:glutathione S-transferase family protein [Rhodospirillaceae bacterium]